jgi:hypothetical protein
MALSSHIKNFAQGRLKIIDGSGTTLTIPYEMGDLAIDGLKRTLNEEVPFEARGKYRGSGHGARVYPTAQFSAMLAELTNVTAGVIMDFLVARGGYSAITNTAGTGPRPLMAHLRWELEGTDYGDDADGSFELKDCHFTFAIAEDSGGGPTKFTISATARGAVYVNGVAYADQIA